MFGDIDISKLLGLLLNIIHASGKKDLRLCGIAALSSSMIHRLKVESIFRLEKVAMQKKTIIDPVTHDPVTDLDAIELPFKVRINVPRIFRRTSSSVREYDLRDLKPGLEEKKTYYRTSTRF